MSAVADGTNMPWTEKAAHTVARTAELLDMSKVQVYRLIADHAFGDPKQLPNAAVGSRSSLRIPTERILDYLNGKRGYPPSHVDNGGTR